MTQVVTELTIDGAGATRGAADYARAMEQAEQAAKRHLGGISSTMESLISDVKSLSIAGVSLTAAGVWIYQWAANTNRELAALDQTARQVSLSLSRFQSLRFAGNVSGLSDEQFAAGLQRSAGLLNDAQRNANSLSKLFEANGASIRNSNGQLITTNQLLGAGADMMRRAATEQDKIKIAEMLGFTREWVPFLEQGADAIERIAAEAKAAGAVIDDQTIKKAAEFDREWRKSSTEWAAYMKAAAADILPYVNQAIDAASKFFSKDNLKSVAQPGNAAIGGALESVLGRFGLVNGKGELEITIHPSVTSAFNKLADDLAKAGVQLGTANERVAAGFSGLPASATGSRGISTAGAVADYAEQAATAEGRFHQAVKKTNDELARRKTVVPGKDEAAGPDAVDRAILQLARHTERVVADTKAIGLGAGALAEFRAEAALTSAIQANNGNITDEQRAKFAKLAKDAGEAATAFEKVRVASDIKWQRDTMLLSSEDAQIARQLAGIYGNDVPRGLASSEAAAIRMNNAMKEIAEGLRDIAKSVFSAFLQGKNVMDALVQATDRLAAKLADSAFDNILGGLMTGNLAQAGIGAVQAGASWLMSQFGNNQRRREEERRAQEEAQRESLQLSYRSQGIGLDTSTRFGSQRSLGIQQSQEWVEAAIRGSRNLVQLQDVHRREMAALNAEWDKREEEALQQKRDQALERARGYEDRYSAAKLASDESLNAQLLSFDRRAQREREQEAKNGNESIVALEQALAAEREQILKKYQEEIVKRQQSYEDRIFQATNDATTLAGQLLAFDREAQREREEELKRGGEAIAELTRAQEAERLQIIRDYYKSIAEFLRGVVNSINDYLRNLRQGDSSTLSAADRLAVAQNEFNQRFALASSGNRDALNDITSYAQNLLEAARDYYASSTDYATIYNQVTSLLQTLSTTLTETTISDADKIVEAIEQGTSSTNSTTVTTSDEEQALLSTMTSLLSTSASLLSSSYSLLYTTSAVLSAINALSDRNVNAINGLGSVLVAIGNTHTSILGQININTYKTAWNSTNGSAWTLWSWLGFEKGGRVPGYDNGGMVTNGIWNRDSVIAALAGGEHVTRATSVNQDTLPTLDFINKFGRNPSNDNGAHFDQLAERIARIAAAAAGAQIEALREENSKLTAEVRALRGGRPLERRGTHVQSTKAA